MSRTSISVTDDVFDRLQALKRDDESWSEFAGRAADALESDGGDVDADPRPVVVKNIDEIARASADEVENRMTRR